MEWMQAPKPPRRDPVELENENQQLREQLDQSQRRIEQLERDKQNLNRNIERLKKELETARRSAKRAAAPFSRGNPKVSPKTPGRKPGARYGRHHHRPRPSQVDEQIGVDLPSQCPECGGPVELQRVESQYQEEIVRRTVIAFPSGNASAANDACRAGIPCKPPTRWGRRRCRWARKRWRWRRI